MSKVHVPQLKPKLALLRDYGARLSQDQLADAFDVQPATLRWWMAGDNAREPDHIPAAKLPILVELVRSALGQSLSEQEVQSLVLGPVDRLARVFRGESDDANAFWPLIETRARVDILSLVLFERDQFDLVQRLRHPQGNAQLRLGQPFAFAMSEPRHEHRALFQMFQGQIALIALERVSATRAKPDDTIPLDASSDPLVEQNDLGRHRFTVLTSTKPLPLKPLHPHGEPAILAEYALASLCRFVKETDADRITVDRLDVDVVA